MTKMIMVCYNEAIDVEVMEGLSQCGLNNYTKIIGAYGKGVISGVHLGNDIWPGRNNILYIACSEKESKQFLEFVKDLRKTLGHEGVKAFVMPLEDCT